MIAAYWVFCITTFLAILLMAKKHATQGGQATTVGEALCLLAFCCIPVLNVLTLLTAIEGYYGGPIRRLLAKEIF